MRRRRSLRGIHPHNGSCSIVNASGTNASRGSRVTMADIKSCAKACGSHWFEPGTMRFFNSRLARAAYADGKGGAFFATTERGPSGKRLASVRHYQASSCSIDTIGEFQGYTTIEAATRAAKRYASNGGLNGARRRRRR